MESSRVLIASDVSTDGHGSPNKSVILTNLTIAVYWKYYCKSTKQPISVSLSNKCQGVLQNKDLLSYENGKHLQCPKVNLDCLEIETLCSDSWKIVHAALNLSPALFFFYYTSESNLDWNTIHLQGQEASCL